jgi:hypothetical protein
MTSKNEISAKPPITPEMKVGDFLKYYPELEVTLIEIAPAFAKLKNPILRKTVARVASLNQAAIVGDVAIGEMINRLRQAAGVEEMVDLETGVNKGSTAKPAWFDIEKVSSSIDARPIIERGEQPLGIVVKELNRLPGDGILELITPFYPSPLIDKAREMGFEAWSEKIDSNMVKSYFCKPNK